MKHGHSRRDFLQMTALSIGTLGLGSSAQAAGASGTVALVLDPADTVASAAPVGWAIDELGRALREHGVSLRRFKSLPEAPQSDFCVIASGSESLTASEILRKAALSLSHFSESLALVPSTHKGMPAFLATGSDPRGLMYALLELADRVDHASDPAQALKFGKPISEEPFNAIRSVGRLFVSDVEDKPWFNDREMWPAYFSMLARHRFNRFHLGFGLGYDSLQSVTDAYFLFAYPFLLSVPGYSVRAVNLPDAERDRNFEMLQFISRQATARGIDFQLGIWTHGYQWPQSGHPNYTIEGLTPENHAEYSRDALAALLKVCPDISGVTLRTHGESGVHEGSYAFWKTVFEGVPQSGRKVGIDLHTKGLDEKMIEGALSTGMPLTLSPKYWAEHLGMPYHQAAIRDLEMPEANAHPDQFSALSTGSRIFTRYGYADFLREDRPYSMMCRVWPGTHRLLLWGDPVWTAAYSRAFRFCGGNGAELLEPLSFKGRRGSGIAGGRCAYADEHLKPRWDWEKFWYTYRTWGRLMYNPNADPDTWRRSLGKQFGTSAIEIESALASASRILPIVTTAHLPSAANDTFSPEFYTNQSIVDASMSAPYGDTPTPKVFENVSPLDPQLFSRIADFTDELLKGEHSGKYSPIEVAQWLEDLAENASTQLAKAEAKVPAGNGPEFRRLAIDVRIQIGLGRFFAAKLRSGTLYAIHERSGDRTSLEQAVKVYRQARNAWAQFAGEAKAVYVPDITIGPRSDERGHWADRLSAIDADIAEMANRLEVAKSPADRSARVRAAIQEAVGKPSRASIECRHVPAERFVPGKPLEIIFLVERLTRLSSIRLYYRHVNQTERYAFVDMAKRDRVYQATIPADFTASQYPVQYYFELKQEAEAAWLYPGFVQELANQPYCVVRAA